MDSIGSGQDPDTERVADHLTSDIVFAAPDWSLEEAAVAMVRGGFRHLVVTTGGEVAGLLSMRDIVRCWTDDGAICDVPARRRSARLRSRPSSVAWRLRGPRLVAERRPRRERPRRFSNRRHERRRGRRPALDARHRPLLDRRRRHLRRPASAQFGAAT